MFPPCSRSTPVVVTRTPLRRTLWYGSDSSMMLSPETVTCSATGGRPGNVIVQPEVVLVALRTDNVGVVSPVVGTVLRFQVPATSARLIGAGAAAAGALSAEV